MIGAEENPNNHLFNHLFNSPFSPPPPTPTPKPHPSLLHQDLEAKLHLINNGCCCLLHRWRGAGTLGNAGATFNWMGLLMHPTGETPPPPTLSYTCTLRVTHIPSPATEQRNLFHKDEESRLHQSQQPQPHSRGRPRVREPCLSLLETLFL